jgi:hypothetical protein
MRCNRVSLGGHGVIRLSNLRWRGEGKKWLCASYGRRGCRKVKIAEN